MRDGSITRGPGDEGKPHWVNIKRCRYDYSLAKDRSKLSITVGVEGFGEKRIELEVRHGAAAVTLFPEDKPRAVFYFAVVKPEEAR